jgi:hypothetical protein
MAEEAFAATHTSHVTSVPSKANAFGDSGRITEVVLYA